MKPYLKNPDRIDPDHALPKAARATNDYVEEHGLRAVFEWLDIGTLEHVSYFAEQRTLRAVVASNYGYALGHDEIQDQMYIEAAMHSIQWHALAPALIAAYLDGIAIGWKAHMIKQEETKKKNEIPDNSKQRG